MNWHYDVRCLFFKLRLFFKLNTFVHVCYAFMVQSSSLSFTAHAVNDFHLLIPEKKQWRKEQKHHKD